MKDILELLWVLTDLLWENWQRQEAKTAKSQEGSVPS